MTALDDDTLRGRVMERAGAARADLLLVPSSAWATVAVTHARMATFRALENGVTLVRPTRQGTSLAVVNQGRLLAYNLRLLRRRRAYIDRLRSDPRRGNPVRPPRRQLCVSVFRRTVGDGIRGAFPTRREFTVEWGASAVALSCHAASDVYRARWHRPSGRSGGWPHGHGGRVQEWHQRHRSRMWRCLCMRHLPLLCRYRLDCEFSGCRRRRNRDAGIRQIGVSRQQPAGLSAQCHRCSRRIDRVPAGTAVRRKRYHGAKARSMRSPKICN